MTKPKRILLIRHAESEGNVDENIYKYKPDYALYLSKKGEEQAIELGMELNKLISFKSSRVYISPYFRTRQTFDIASKQHRFGKATFDPRLREQEFSNLQTDDINRYLKERKNIGHFFYRFPNGESGADVYDRVSDFISTLHRDFDNIAYPENTIIISHGLTIRLFLMRWFHLSVEEFELLRNPDNASIISLILDSNTNKYILPDLPKYIDLEHTFIYKYK